MSKLRVGIIGLGVGARHAAAYAGHPAVEVAMLCDLDAIKLKGVGQRYPGARLTHDAQDVLCDPTINAVSIASYDADHYPQIVAALEHDKHVLAEKPLCLYPREAEHIRRLLATRPGLVLSSHFPLRQTPLYRELIADVQAGVYGQLYFVSADYNYGRFGKLLNSWRSEAEYYSVVLSGGVHLIDLLLQVSGDKVVAVQAMSNNIVSANTRFRFPDCVVATLQFESGLLATVTCNFGNVSPHFTPLKAYGTKAVFDQTWQGAFRYTSRDSDDSPERVTTPYRQEKQADSDPVIHSFVDAILQGREPLVTAIQVFEALDVCFAINESLQAAVPVTVHSGLQHRV